DDRRTVPIDRGQLVPGCKIDDEITMNHRPRASCHDQAAIRTMCESGDVTFDLASVAYSDWSCFHSKRCRYRLNSAELTNSSGCAGIANTCHSCYARRELLE